MAEPYYAGDLVTLHLGDCLDVMAGMPDASVDAVVCDPPYGLAEIKPETVVTALTAWLGGDRMHVPDGRGFMGREWDRFVPPPGVWDECLRVLKPGGWLLAFAAPRTADLMGLSIRLAGLEVRDSLHWIYGSGFLPFPKSLDVSKAIDKQRDDYPAVREVVEFLRAALDSSPTERRELEEAFGGGAVVAHFLAPSRSNAGCPNWAQWQRLKEMLRFGDEMDAEVWRLNGRKGEPGEAWSQREVIGRSDELLGRKSGIGNATKGHYTVGGTVARAYDITAPATEDAARWSGWGTALKPSHEPIIVARKPLSEGTVAANVLRWGTGALNVDGCRVGTTRGVPASLSRDKMPNVYGGGYGDGDPKELDPNMGRWPPNLLLVHSASCNGTCAPGCPVAGLDGQSGTMKSPKPYVYAGKDEQPGDRAAYSPGLGYGVSHAGEYGDSGGASRFFPQFTWDPEHDLPFMYCAKAPKSERPQAEGISAHPTVKPLAVMRWLVRLVTPPGGLVLDPFAGTGTTGQACALEGFRCVLAERDPDSAELARVRLAKSVQRQMTLI